MKTRLLAVLFSLSVIFSLQAKAEELVIKTLVISDIDDTVKVTNVLNKPMKIFNSLFSKKAFSGMAELYQEFFAEETAIYYLSGSPTYLKKKIHHFLESNSFPQIHQTILKTSKGLNHFDYKSEAIKTLLAKIKPQRLVLIGDDTQVDPEVYDSISKENPGLVSAIYIRAVRDRKLPANPLMKSFFSPVEIAGHEYLKNTMSEASFKIVANGFLNQDKKSKLFIKRRYCPENGRDELLEIKQRLNNQALITLVEKSQKKIEEACR